MVKLRLSQTGTKNRKTYRIIAIDQRSRRNGKAIETLGSYDPLVKPAKLTVKHDRVSFWVSQGAQISEGLAKLLSQKLA